MSAVKFLAVFTVWAGLLAFLLAVLNLRKLRHACIVPEGYAGLLYHKGKFIKLLDVGRHVRWGFSYTMRLQDLRRASTVVPGQDVLTADNIGLKISLLITYEIGAQLLARVQPDAAKIGIDVLAIAVKDVMFPADLKRAFADVLKAKQEGQAALERARGESAALRNLANAARVLEGNPALMNLRLLQSLSAAQNAGNTLVLGVPGGFVPLNAKGGSPPSNLEDSGAS
jgi:regulator of protease activity HflC (stomatin/prohibitin superfamily)